MDRLVIAPIEGGYELVEEFRYKDIVVPKGFRTDGLTIKIRLLYMFIGKYDPRCIEAAVVHDYLCELEQYELADEVFEEMLPEIWQKPYMVRAVKLYHKIKY